jgi:hypothetical protein
MGFLITSEETTTDINTISFRMGLEKTPVNTGINQSPMWPLGYSSNEAVNEGLRALIFN